MSFSQSYIAATGQVERLRDVFLETWTNLRLVEESAWLAFPEQLYAWSSPRHGRLDAAGEHIVVALFRDRRWAVMADFSLCLINDEGHLRRLSERFGYVAACLTQGTSGVVGL